MVQTKFRNRSELVRLFVLHWAVGFGISAAFVAAIVFFDFGGLGRLMLKEPITIFMLWFFAGSTFGAAQTAMTVMSLTDDEWDGGGSKTPQASEPLALQVAPAPQARI